MKVIKALRKKPASTPTFNRKRKMRASVDRNHLMNESSSWCCDFPERVHPGLPDGTYIFRPKIRIWVNFGGSCNGRCWYSLWTLRLLYGHLVYFVVIWYIFPVLVCCTKKNLASPVHPKKIGGKRRFKRDGWEKICHDRPRFEIVIRKKS
jgi:hypothetical protein